MLYDIRLTMHYDYDARSAAAGTTSACCRSTIPGVQRVVAASLAVHAGAGGALRLHRFLRQPRHLDRLSQAA